MKKKNISRLLSFSLSLIILLGSIAGTSLTAFADGGSLVYPGGDEYFTDEAHSTDAHDNAWVYISKTATDSSSNTSLSENEFEVTLVAKTKENLEEFSVLKDTQVVLVLDTSLSMSTYCAECGATYSNGSKKCCSKPETRLDRTKSAVAAFLDSYAATAVGTSAHRYVAVVEYGIQARYYQPTAKSSATASSTQAWIDVNPSASGAATNLSNMKTWIKGLGTTAGTNTDSALAVADALLNDSTFNPYMSVENKNLILFTDGIPNLRMATAGQTLGASSGRPSPYPFPNNQSTSTSDAVYNAANPAAPYKQPLDKANAIRSNNINIFTVGYGGDGATSSDGVYSTGWRQALVWLETLAGNPDNAYVANGATSLDDLIRSFEEICRQAVWEGIAPYVVTDPMGPYFKWNSSNSLNAITGQSFAQNSFVWDLKKAGLPVKDAEGWYTYTYKYKITFDVEEALAAGYTKAFDASQGAPLNEPTTLTFAKLVNDEIVGGVKTVDYKLPKAVFEDPTVPPVVKYPYTVKYYKDSIAGENLLDSAAGTTKFEAGYTLVNADVEADLGAGWVDAEKPEGYNSGSETYVTITVNPENNVVTVVYTQIPQIKYPYTVKYYKDSIADGNLLGSVSGTTEFVAGYTLENADVSADLGAEWIDAKKPLGYKTGFETYVTITINPETNVVTVVYTAMGGTHKVSLGWMRSSELPEARFLKPVDVDGDAWSYNEAFNSTPIKYFESLEVQAVANEKAAEGTENATIEDEQLVGMRHIWDNGNYFDKYKNENGNVTFGWASWKHFGESGTIEEKGEYSIRRFAAYVDFSAEDLMTATSIMLAPEDELGNMSYLFPLNDNVFVFVNGKLAFWGGTDVKAGQNQHGALNRTEFMGKEGIKVRNGVNGVFKDIYPHTDGWCIDLEDNAEAVDIKNLLKPGFNRIDIITDEYWEGGGMNQLSLYAKN